MSMPPGASLNLQIEPSVVQDLVRQQLTAQIATVLQQNTGALMMEIVNKTLTSKVDSDGKPSQYRSDRDLTLLQWMANKAIREALQECLKEAIAKDKEKIKVQFAEMLKKQGNKLFHGLADAMVNAIGQEWNIKFNVGVEASR